MILGRVLALPDEEDDPYDGAFTLPAEAYKAGVKFAFGTFTNEFVRNLPYQAATAVAFGLPYEEALKAVTINAAEIWGKSDEIGSVEKGKWADLMVTDGDPLDVAAQIEHVYIKGKEIELVQQADPAVRQVHGPSVARPITAFSNTRSAPAWPSR